MDDMLLYASFSKGFKSGGYDGSTILDPVAAAPFFGETVFAYEVGFKATILDDKLRWNSALFFYDYEDLQAEAFVEVIPGVQESVRTNAGDAEILGFEMDIWWKPAEGLDIKFALQFLDTELTTWNSIEPTEVDEFVGNELANAPHVTFSGLVRYEWPVYSNKNMAIQTNFNYNDEAFKTIDNDSRHQADDYFLLNARLSLFAHDHSWDVSLWAKNITDEQYIIQSLLYLGDTIQSFGAPRSYGIGFSCRL